MVKSEFGKLCVLLETAGYVPDSCKLRHIYGRRRFSPPEKVIILGMSENRSSKWPQQNLTPGMLDSNS